MFLDATTLGQMVLSKEISPLELVEESIQKATLLNSSLNAIVYTQYEEAIEKAKRFSLKNQPFAGVPLFLKDLGQEQKGSICTYGSRLFKDVKSMHTDNFVKRLENLGFIILGRTNTPEFGFKTVSDSLLYGPVRNAVNLDRNAGGSSGGAAAVVASGITPVAAASDGGGSIRIPASHNGLIGLKPSRGRVISGPGSYRGWNGATVHFALTKTVQDTRNLLFHLQEYQMESPFPLPKLSAKELYPTEKMRPLRVAVLLQSPVGEEVSKDSVDAVMKVANFFENHGHSVTLLQKDPVDGIALQKGFYIISAVETALMFQNIERQLGRQVTSDDMELMTWAIYRSGLDISGMEYSKVASSWDSYAYQMAQLHEQYDVLLLPAVANAAPSLVPYELSADLQSKLSRIDDFTKDQKQQLLWEMFEESVADTPFTQRFNITGQPAISLPVHHTKDGLPIGVQLAAAKGREDLLLQIAEWFEQGQLLQVTKQ
ncbi:6-aminohexanoate-cyclic-dimer hydrolase [Granulicatella adiacens]|uniref:amidase n=1 Tax=Granulicatella adiacens TaxID=46124 RepID=UPI0019584D1C|nr:amidase [Granulicatella adiacens]VTX76726.1 6-aminohexanoate-cyclic-dimer hydrolase [Granulicatella adiacens]